MNTTRKDRADHEAQMDDEARGARIRAQTSARREEWGRIALKLHGTKLADIDAFQEWYPDYATDEPVMTYADAAEVTRATRIMKGVGWTVDRRERPDLGENGCVALVAYPPAGWDAQWPEAEGDEGPLAVLPLGPLSS